MSAGHWHLHRGKTDVLLIPGNDSPDVLASFDDSWTRTFCTLTLSHATKTGWCDHPGTGDRCVHGGVKGYDANYRSVYYNCDGSGVVTPYRKLSS